MAAIRKLHQELLTWCVAGKVACSRSHSVTLTTEDDTATLKGRGASLQENTGSLWLQEAPNGEWGCVVGIQYGEQRTGGFGASLQINNYTAKCSQKQCIVLFFYLCIYLSELEFRTHFDSCRIGL